MYRIFDTKEDEDRYYNDHNQPQQKTGGKPLCGIKSDQTAELQNEFLRNAEALKAQLDDGLALIDAIQDVATRSVALHTLQRELGLNERTFSALVQTLSEAKSPKTEETSTPLWQKMMMI